VGSLVVNTYAIAFATSHESGALSDIVLSNTPAFAVDDLFVYGTVIAGTLTIAILLAHPRRISFALKGMALFFLIRSGFTVLTHEGPFIPATINDFGPFITKMFFGGDYFFSGHTGLPFLGALAYWKEPALRYFYLFMSVFFACVVLLGHLHYSIDVAAAFFITYTIYDLAVWLFPRDYTLFHSSR
jgi:hypothetical protein